MLGRSRRSSRNVRWFYVFETGEDKDVLLGLDRALARFARFHDVFLSLPSTDEHRLSY